MNRIILGIALVILLGACNQTVQKEGETKADQTEKIIAATIEELVASPADDRTSWNAAVME